MSNIETDEIQQLAEAFAALSNPQRLRMFVTLASRCCAPDAPPAGKRLRFCCATEVGRGLDLAASTVSHHLKELRQAGLMHVERHGRRIDCWASEEALRLLASFFAGLGRRTGQSRGRTSAAPAVTDGGRAR